MFEQKIIGNSRFLYFQSGQWWSFWSPEVSRIDLHIETLPQIQLAGDEVFFYFHQNPSKDDFLNHPVWLGREIIGFLGEQDAAPFEVYDFYRSSVLSQKLPFESVDLDKWDRTRLLSWVQESMKELDFEAKHWRIRLSYPQVVEKFSVVGQLEIFPLQDKI